MEDILSFRKWLEAGAGLPEPELQQTGFIDTSKGITGGFPSFSLNDPDYPRLPRTMKKQKKQKK